MGKTNKCNQCDFTTVQAGNLRRHLKAHSGEKLKKETQYDFASVYASALIKHMK